ncbi:hypothetical protein [Niastella sp. OAS944]|uniref:hypothetical protein n=1 Tax=Niastella sp. OAS944 TaxID=2664089 RepID=UPI003489051A|nr:flagellar hook assembly protein FlgD [Chitinophagaceae bacterium OAS944]
MEIVTIAATIASLTSLISIISKFFCSGKEKKNNVTIKITNKDGKEITINPYNEKDFETLKQTLDALTQNKEVGNGK